jgi:hypothetical protein
LWPWRYAKRMTFSINENENLLMPELRQREPRVEDEAFLDFVRARPCCVPACGAPPRSHAAHVRMACPARGKRETGKGERPSDRWAVPLCQACHQDGPLAQHRGAEAAFWRRAGINPLAIAEALYAAFKGARPMMAPGIECEFVIDDANPGVARPVSPEKDPELYRPFPPDDASGRPKRPPRAKRASDSAAKVGRPKRKCLPGRCVARRGGRSAR